MLALKSTLIAMLLLLAGNAVAVETPHFEKQSWKVQPRSPAQQRAKTPLGPPEELPTSHVEELPSAEPPPGTYDSPILPRLQFVDVELPGAVRQAGYVATDPSPGMLYGPDPQCCDGMGGCDGMGCNRCQPLYWGRLDYLYWYLSGANVPPLVTTSPANTDREDAGVLGLSTTSVLVGNEKFGESGLSGGRIEFGGWLPRRGGLGWHVAFLGMENAKDRIRLSGSGLPILARPFFSVEPAFPGSNAELVSFPGELEGTVSVDAATSFEAAELMLHWMIDRNPNRRIRLGVGYQYKGLDDDLVVADFKRVIGGSSGLAIGTTLTENDQFRTQNRFDGVAFGVLGSMRNCRATVDLGMQLALGNSRSKIQINGSSTASVPLPGGPNDVVTSPGGLLTQASNIGHYEDDSFAVVPELHLGLGYELTPQARLLLAYRFLYWSQVARAAEQIDLGVNLSQLDPTGLEGDPRPRFDLKLTDFWAQGISVGVDYRY